jgi:hypothetical protein
MKPKTGFDYKHYKGDTYRVILTGVTSEATGEDMTVYAKVLEPQVVAMFGQTFVRPTTEFMEKFTIC